MLLFLKETMRKCDCKKKKKLIYEIAEARIQEMAEIILKPNSGFKRLYFNNLDTLKSINFPDCEAISIFLLLLSYRSIIIFI